MRDRFNKDKSMFLIYLVKSIFISISPKFRDLGFIFTKTSAKITAVERTAMLWGTMALKVEGKYTQLTNSGGKLF